MVVIQASKYRTWEFTYDQKMDARDGSLRAYIHKTVCEGAMYV